MNKVGMLIDDKIAKITAKAEAEKQYKSMEKVHEYQKIFDRFE